jgi:heat shock protein HslJ
MILSILVLISCNNSSTKEQDENVITWEGTYSNVMPCADCEGIQTTIVLNKNMTYLLITKYLNKDMNVFSQKGTFSWDRKENKITLEGVNPNEAPTKYISKENKLIQLDIEGKPLEENLQSQYSLEKISDIIEKPWKLVELNEKEIITSNKSEEACFIMNIDNYRINGNGGCNSFNGNYILYNGNKIKFTSFTTTRKACKNMEIETKLFEAMKLVSNYSIKQDTLFLNTETVTPVAKFVYTEKP